jgi:hypothetical protein
LRSAFISPIQAFKRLYTRIGRPSILPLALWIGADGTSGVRACVLLLGQSLHRFLPDAELQALIAWAGPVDAVIAGTDFDDEEATVRLISRFEARHRIIADLTGDIRRRLHLPVRPLSAVVRAAPIHTQALAPGQTLALDV